MSEAVNRVHHTTGLWHANESLDVDSETSIHIPNENLGRENNQVRTPGDKHRNLPRDDREGYAKCEGCVIDASSYAKSQQKYSM